MDAYLAKPAMVSGAFPAFRFIVPSTESPTFSGVSGRASHITGGGIQPSRTIKIVDGKRNVEIDLDRRKSVNVAQNNRKPDYCPTPHPFFLLAESALPEGTPAHILETARSAFSCSIKRQTQNNYSTGVRHLRKCEELLGRPFSSPMQENEKLFYTSYLLSKGLRSETVQAYLTHVNFFELSQGVQNPDKTSKLGRQLVQGLANEQRNPIIAANEKTRLRISGN